jgi:hypothetical protein
MKRKAHAMRRLLFLFFFAGPFCLHILRLDFIGAFVDPPRVYAEEKQISVTSQSEWSEGFYENSDIDIATSSGDIRLLLTWDLGRVRPRKYQPCDGTASDI